MDDPMDDTNDGVGNYDIDDVLGQTQPLDENRQAFLDSVPPVEEPLPSDVYPTQYNEVAFPQHQLQFPHDDQPPLFSPQDGHHRRYRVVPTAAPPPQQPPHHHQQQQQQTFYTGQNHHQAVPPHNFHNLYPPVPNHLMVHPPLLEKRSQHQFPALQDAAPLPYFQYQHPVPGRQYRQQIPPSQLPHQHLPIQDNRPHVQGASQENPLPQQHDPTSLIEIQPLQHHWQYQQKTTGAQHHIPFPPIAMEPRTWWDTENSTQIEPDVQIPPPPTSPLPGDLLRGPSAVQQQTVPQQQQQQQQFHLRQQQDLPPPPIPRQPRTQPRPATFHPIDEETLCYANPAPFRTAPNQLHQQEQLHQPYPSHHSLPQNRQYYSSLRPVQMTTHQQHDDAQLPQQQQHQHDNNHYNRTQNTYQQFHSHPYHHHHQQQQQQQQQPTQQGPPRGLTPIPTQVGELSIQNPVVFPTPHWATILNNNKEHKSASARMDDDDGAATNNFTLQGPSPFNQPAIETMITTTITTDGTASRPRPSMTAPSNRRAKKGPTAAILKINTGGNKNKTKNDGESVAQYDTYVLRIHEMLEDAESGGHTHIVSWQEHGRAFKIHKADEFYATVLPQYFVAKKVSFHRWLRAWGFVKHTEGRDRGAYFHRYFVRGVTTLIKRLTRAQMLDAMENWLEPGELPDFYAMVTHPNRCKQGLKQKRRIERNDEREAKKRRLEEVDDTDDHRDGSSHSDKNQRQKKMDANESNGGSQPEKEDNDSHCFDHVSDCDDSDQPEHLKPMENPRRLRGSLIEDVRQMLEDAEREDFTHIVSWLPSGTAFKVYNRTAFVDTIMGKYIKAHRFTHFSDSLRNWGFQRLKNEKGSSRNAYYHRLFQKDRPKLSRHLSKLQMCEAMADYKKQQLKSSLAYKLNYGTGGMIHNNDPIIVGQDGNGVGETQASLNKFDDEMDESNRDENQRPPTVPTNDNTTQKSMIVDANAQMITADMRLYTDDPMNYLEPNDMNKIRHRGDLYLYDTPYQLLPPIGQGHVNTGELAVASTSHPHVRSTNGDGKETPLAIMPKNVHLSHHGQTAFGVGTSQADPSDTVTDQFMLHYSSNKSYTTKIHQMLEESEIDGYGHICSWRQHGRAFQIQKGTEFQTKILPRFFGAKLPNFFRWLRAWGFLRITSGRDRNCWYHRYFVRGVTDLCSSLTRTEMFDAMQDWLPPGREPDFYSSGKGDIFSEATSIMSQRKQKDNNQRVRNDDGNTKTDAVEKATDHGPDSTVTHVDPRKLRGTILQELREMLLTAKSDGYEDIVGWQIHGKAFMVRDKKEFIDIMLPRFFKSSQYCYFADTLRSWGFVRLKKGRDKGAFYHKWFVEKKPQMSLHLSRSQMKIAMTKFKASDEPDLYEGLDASKLGHLMCLAAQRLRQCKKNRTKNVKQKMKVAQKGRIAAPKNFPTNAAPDTSEAISVTFTDSEKAKAALPAERPVVYLKSG